MRLGLIVAIASLAAFGGAQGRRGGGDAVPWPADGTLTFIRSSGRDAEILMRDRVGKEQVLARGPGTWGSPAWSRDGTSLAFVWRSAAGGGYHLHVRDLDGHSVRLTRGNWIDASPSWSPGGVRIAFSSNRGGDGGFAIFVINADGTELREIASGQDPAWSPDGSAIAHVRRVDEGFGLFLVSPEGREVRRLADGVVVRGDPAWSPDGTRLAFSCGAEDGDICILDLSDGRVALLTDGPDHDEDPAWSPDGETIAFARTAAQERDLWLASVRSGATQRITDHALFESAPSWRLIGYPQD